jgi:hypothetical protein
MPKFLQWPRVLVVAAFVLPIPTFIACQLWRDHAVRSFCREVRVGMPVADLIELERRHWIDSSYLVLFTGIDFEHQAQMAQLTFRSHMLDPDFECAVTQNGVKVTETALVPE